MKGLRPEDADGLLPEDADPVQKKRLPLEGQPSDVLVYIGTDPDSQQTVAEEGSTDAYAHE